jgi:uncharacterized protein (TIGR03437 family)
MLQPLGINQRLVSLLLWLAGMSAATALLNAQGSFQPAFQATNFQLACSDLIVTGDFNGDQNPDFAVICEVTSEVSVWLGNGDGTFRTPLTTSFTAAPIQSVSQMIAVDVNGDGKTDLVYSGIGPRLASSDYGGGTSTVNLLLSNGDGTFAAPKTVVASLADAQLLRTAADLNGDGIPDLILDGWGIYGPPGVMFGNGDGTFSPLQLLPLPKTMTEPGNISVGAVADLDGDGKPDIIMYLDSSSFSASQELVWLAKNLGNGSFATPVLIATPGGGYSANGYAGTAVISVADFNGDEILDLGIYVRLFNIQFYFYVYLGNGDGTFQAPFEPYQFPTGVFLAVDLDGAGHADLIQTIYQTPNLVVYLETGKGGGFGALNPLGFTDKFNLQLVTADFNNDGKPDFVAGTDPGVAVLINTSNAPALFVPSVSGVANGASFQSSQPVTGGALVSVFGSRLATSSEPASGIPLGDTLGGISVTLGGFPAPLSYVSATQINLQVPWEVSGSDAAMVVTLNGTALPPLHVSLASASPGIFTTQSGTGQAIAINSDGSLAGPEGSIPGVAVHPANPGDSLVILATGLGAVTPTVTDGANSLDTLRRTVNTPVVLIGGLTAEVQFSGLSPQFVGVNQINVTVPQVAAGVVPLQIMDGTTTSDSVTIAVANQ